MTLAATLILAAGIAQSAGAVAPDGDAAGPAAARRPLVESAGIAALAGLGDPGQPAVEAAQTGRLFDGAPSWNDYGIVTPFGRLAVSGSGSGLRPQLPPRPEPIEPQMIARRAAAAPVPRVLVGRQRESSYEQVVAYMAQVSHRSGLDRRLKQLGVDPLPFMLALVKAESEFRQHVVSGSNAYGYSQVIVPTAREVLVRNRHFYERMTGETLVPAQVTGQRLLDDWRMNLMAGILYLKEHVQLFYGLVRQLPTPDQQGKMLINLIASAYNAGPYAVAGYLTGKRPAQVTRAELESLSNNDRALATVAAAAPEESVVPYEETRGYVRKIQSSYETWRTAWSSWADLRLGAPTPPAGES